jgi:two-component system sensor histidine kinase UhpB
MQSAIHADSGTINSQVLPTVTARNKALLKFHDAQEEVARRIAQRLHDDAAQMLALVYLELAQIAHESPADTTRKIASVVQKLDEVCEQLRHLSHELRPLILDQRGLMPGLRFLADGVSKRSGLDLVVAGGVTAPMGKQVETVLYRIVQEALSNVVRHSGATAARISLWEESGQVHCTVSDNGSGFLLPASSQDALEGLGLIGIHERVTALNGDCRIHSRHGQGTELQVEIPL